MAIQALVMGFGGTGAHILTYVKEQAVLKYGAKPETVRFLLFDTIADWRPGATVRIAGGAGEETMAKGTETSLDPDREYYFLKDHDPTLRQYVYELLAPGGHPERHPQFKDWLHTPWLRDNIEKAQMEIVVGAAQQRQIGRFAIFQNAQKVVDQVRREVRELARESHGAPVNVWLVGSSAGGTGAGCLLDAAHLTRIAVGNQTVSVTGVIVLPEVYDDKAGIIRGRSYSLFRELNRFQLQGIPDKDRYLLDGKLVASSVLYDDRDQLRSIVPNKLFDNLFFVGSSCRSDDARTGFFTSVASAIDPFLDENAGPPLLEKSVNADAAASAFGAARLYVPKESLGELFAWQQVERYLRSASAFVEEDGRRRLASGSAKEREEGALSKAQALSPLFEKILELEGVDETIRKFARTLQPAQIVEEWYGTAAPQVIGLTLRPEEILDIKLTHAAPAYSWREHDPERVPVADRTTKTASEYRSAAKALGLGKEGRDASRDRFAQELEAVMRKYKDQDSSAQSFEKGRRLLFAKLSQHVRGKVDQMIFETIEQTSRFGVDETAPQQGTALTCLYQELREMLADSGPFRVIDHRIRLFIEALQKEEEQRQHEAVQAIQELREWKPRFLGGDAEALQVAARESVSDYFKVFQRDRLLADLQKLVREVQGRVEEWERIFRSTFDTLVIDPGSSCRADTVAQIKRLESRLARLARNPKARISVDPDWSPDRPGEDMLGYRQALAERCTVGDQGEPLAAAVLRSSSWQASVDARGRPVLRLSWESQGRSGESDVGDLAQLHQRLYGTFRAAIDNELKTTDVFDYLAWVERERRITAEQIAQTLNAAAVPLINAQGPETCHLAVRRPNDKEKERWISSISEELRKAIGVAGFEQVPYSDCDSINVFRIVKPTNLEDFRNVVDCRADYVHWQGEPVKPDDTHRRELKRAQVYHPFRPELEAWFIERRDQQLQQRRRDHAGHLSPRLARLLEDPAMLQAFVECVSTGAVLKSAEGNWIWHSGREEIGLTVDGAGDDVIRAAVVFVLQKREGFAHGLRKIDLEAARRSARERAQEAKKTVAQVCAEFLASGLDNLLRELRPAEHGQIERDRDGLRMLFEFYGQQTTKTELDRRTDLMHNV